MSGPNARAKVVAALGDSMSALRLKHPTRVAVDGRMASGKTTLADELAVCVAGLGRKVVRASIDDFHRPGHKYRSIRGDWTPQTYYDEGFDYDGFRSLVLLPLSPGGSRRCRTALWDSFLDQEIPANWTEVEADGIVIVDGVFLQRPELVCHWDYVIWVDADAATILERAKRRDVSWIGAEEEVERRSRQLWLPAHDLYEGATQAPCRAHALVDNDNPDAPALLRTR